MEADQKRPVAQLTEAAIRNHEELFPGSRSKLQETDPELIETFDNFAFDEVIRQSNLEVKTRVMVILASTIASQALTEYKVMLGAALNVGVTPVEAKEILYQAVPYVGIAKVLDFIYATNEVLQARGVALPLEGQATTTPETRLEQGLARQKEIFGSQIDKMYAAAPDDQRHIQIFLSANCFGDTWTRRGLDLQDARAPDLLHAGGARGRRAAAEGTYPGQPQCRQRQGDADRGAHAAPAVHRLSADAERAGLRE